MTASRHEDISTARERVTLWQDDLFYLSNRWYGESRDFEHFLPCTADSLHWYNYNRPGRPWALGAWPLSVNS